MTGLTVCCPTWQRPTLETRAMPEGWQESQVPGLNIMEMGKKLFRQNASNINNSDKTDENAEAINKSQHRKTVTSQNEMNQMP